MDASSVSQVSTLVPQSRPEASSAPRESAGEAQRSNAPSAGRPAPAEAGNSGGKVDIVV